MQVSGAFVCLMCMAVTFVGLSCIILLTMLMGKVMGAMDRRKAPEQIPLPAHPAVPADGLTDEIKIAIMAAIAQDPGFNMANVSNVSIRKL